jgi:hypothetical protein
LAESLAHSLKPHFTFTCGVTGFVKVTSTGCHLAIVITSLALSAILSRMVDVIHSNTHFLARDALYDHEKPYSLRFTPPEGFPRANIKLEQHDIDIQDIRPQKDSLEFARDGFSIINFVSKMTYDDYDDENTIHDVLLKEIANAMRKFLGAQHVQIFEHTVSARSLH